MKLRKRLQYADEERKSGIEREEKKKGDKREEVRIIMMRMNMMRKDNGINIRKYLVMMVVMDIMVIIMLDMREKLI